MKSKTTAPLPPVQQREESDYFLPNTLDHYEINELSMSQLTKYLSKIRKNKATTDVPASAAFRADNLRLASATENPSTQVLN